MPTIFIIISLFIAHIAHGFDIKAKYAILIDVQSKQILFAKNAYDRMFPSSMSKMMTAYVVFDRLKRGDIKLDDRFTHSEKAWRMPGSRMFIPLGHRVTIRDLLMGLIVQSGNDAAVTLAEALSGSEEEFAKLLNYFGKQLKLRDTNFVNSTGLPDANHYTTAYDLAKIAMATIIEFPDLYTFYSKTSFAYNKIRQQNRNNLLLTYKGVDGLKTGHTSSAGYGLTSSAVRNGRRLVGVVNGLSSERERQIESEKLLSYGFLNYNNYVIAERNKSFYEIPVAYGVKKTIAVTVPEDVIISVKNTERNNFKAKLNFNSVIKAPINEGDKIAELILYYDNHDVAPKIIDIKAIENIPQASFIKRIFYNINYYLTK